MSGHCVRGAVVNRKTEKEEQKEVRDGVKIEVNYGRPLLGTAWRGWILKWWWAPGRECCLRF